MLAKRIKRKVVLAQEKCSYTRVTNLSMVDVFKTNVQESGQARQLVVLLLQHFPETSINFDLEDCDKVLRVEGNGLQTDRLARLVRDLGFTCIPLE